jgi:chromate transporter
MSTGDLLALFLHFATLSLLSVGGAISTLPGMHRFLVQEHGWLSDTQFTASVALAQAAPGPNILFVTVLGWNAAGWQGALATTVGIMAPSTVLVLMATSWVHRNREGRLVRAFTAGMMPLTVGLMLATGWLLAQPFLADRSRLPNMLGLFALTLILMLRTRIAPVWLVVAGGLLGALGWI